MRLESVAAISRIEARAVNPWRRNDYSVRRDAVYTLDGCCLFIGPRDDTVRAPRDITLGR